MSSAKIPNCEDPSTWLTYDDYLAHDRGVVPDILRERGEDADLRAMEVDARCFHSGDYFEREVERLWNRAWLYACRENDIPKMGEGYFANAIRIDTPEELWKATGGWSPQATDYSARGLRCHRLL